MTDVEALQRALAAEHAAVYGYGVAGARLRGRARAEATRAYDEHLAGRNRLIEAIADAGAQPVAAAPAYDLPFTVRTAGQARRLAIVLEEGVAASYVNAVANSEGDLRHTAALGVQQAGVRAARWRGRSVAFPGLDDPAH